MTKNKKLFLFIFLFIFLFLNFTSVFALEVKDYPSVPGVQAPTDCGGASDKDCLPRLVTYFVGLGIYLAAGIAVISFAVGGVQYIASLDSTQMQSDAKDRMKGAVLGLLITVSSIVILKTISDDLVKLRLNPLPGVAGVFYTSGESKAPAPVSENDTTKIKENYDKIRYCCSEDCNGGTGPALLIWNYPNAGLQGNGQLFSGVTVSRLECGGSESIPPSFKTAYEELGIYYFMEPGCSGYMSEVNTNSQDKISDPFRQNVKSIRIVNDSYPENTFFYGAIFHKEEGLKNGGECTLPISSMGEDESCQNVNIQASAVDIFLANQYPEYSGSGVDFYSEEQGWDTGAQAGLYNVDANQISANLTENFLNPKEMCFGYENVYRPDWYIYKCSGSSCGGNPSAGFAQDCNGPEDCQSSVCLHGKCASGGECINSTECPDMETCDNDGLCSALGSIEGVDCSEYACETFWDCPGSIDIKGGYLVAVYAKQSKTNSNEPDNSKPPLCQTFTKDAENLDTEQILKSGAKEINGIYIIPTE